MRWSDAQRDPSSDPTPLDRASFYVEELKYGPGAGRLEGVDAEQIVAQLEVLLRDAGVSSMTGEQLLDAMVYYGVSLASSFTTHPTITLSLFLDGLMHGIALAGGLVGEPREHRASAS